MRGIFVLSLFCMVIAVSVKGQNPQPFRTQSADPTGLVCSSGDVIETIPNGKIYTCQNGAYAQASGSGGLLSGTLAAIPATCTVGVSLYQATDQPAGLQLYQCSATNTWTPTPYTRGTSNPATCVVGQVIFRTNATAGQNWYFCTATNTWTQQLNSGAASAGTPLQKGDGSGGFSNTNLTENADGTDIAGEGLVEATLSTPTYNAGGTTTCNLSVSNGCSITMSGGNTTLALTNPHGSGPYRIQWTQDSTCRTVTYPGTVSSGTPQPACGTGIVHTMGFTWDGTTYQNTFNGIANSGWHGVQATPVTFSNLPTCTTGPAGYSGSIAMVSDSSTNVDGATVTGGGANVVPAFCNATNWIVAAGAAPGADQVQISTAFASLPACLDSAGNHLNYNTSTHAFSCGTTQASTPSVFDGSGTLAPAFSATPTFSLANASNKSPVRIEPGAMTANVTSVTFTNKTAGAKFSIVWLEDGTGGRTLTHGASVVAGSVCEGSISTAANAFTEQFYEVEADGATVIGVGCSGSDKTIRGLEVSAPATPVATAFVCWPDSTDHSGLECKANNSANIFKMVLTGVDINPVNGQLTITATTCTNQLVSAISARGVGTCTTVTLASAQFANQGTTTQVLHGNGAGNPSWTAVVGADFGSSIAARTVLANATAAAAAPSFSSTVDPTAYQLAEIPSQVEVCSAGGTGCTTGAFTTSGVGTALETITGLSWTFPANTALNIPFDCHITYHQNSANANVNFGYNNATVAQTNLTAHGIMQTTTAAPVPANLVNSAPAANTSTAFFTAASPSAITTNWNVDIFGYIEQPSNGSSSLFTIRASTATAADTVTVVRGSYCHIGI